MEVTIYTPGSSQSLCAQIASEGDLDSDFIFHFSSPVFIPSTTAGAFSLVSGVGALLPLGTPHTCAATTSQVLGKKVKPKPSLPCRELPQQVRGSKKKNNHEGVFQLLLQGQRPYLVCSQKTEKLNRAVTGLSCFAPG